MRVLLALLVLTQAEAVVGQSADCDDLVMRELSPSPAVAGNPMMVRVFGEWPVFSSPYVTGASVSGAEIRISVEGPNTGAASVLPFWEDFVGVGSLNPGAYDLYADVTVGPGGPNERQFSCGPTRQVVVPGVPVPALLDAGRLLLAALLGGCGFLRPSKLKPAVCSAH